MVHRCVGAIIYDDVGRIFLMTSPKWKGWIVPGGHVEEGETDEEALRREIRQELGITLEDIVMIGEKRKPPSTDFYDSRAEFHFIDYIARACSTIIMPNEEILSWGWFQPQDTKALPMPDEMRALIEKYQQYRGKNT